MVVVIDPKQQLLTKRCDCCNALLQYTESDIKEICLYPYQLNDYFDGITCPSCELDLIL